MVLRVESLKINFRLEGKECVQAVDDISFTLDQDEYLGIVGESGCGKSTAIKSILRILPPNGEIVSGHIFYKGKDLVSLPLSEMRKIRWKEISMVSQDAMNSLNPVRRIGDQIIEVIRIHENVRKDEALERAEGLFDLVGIEKKRIYDYPHQFSGGMRQRAMIAMALALNPSIIIADEPTTALDVIVQYTILKQISELRKAFKKSMIIITHDVSVVVENCGRVAVMYAGKIMEYGNTKRVFTQPCHPYTIGLKNAFPEIKGPTKDLISIPGELPSLIHPPKGCRFFERCPFGEERCRKEPPPIIEVGPDHFSACHFPERSEEFRNRGKSVSLWDAHDIRKSDGQG
jgi:oligopeptide/dipeptide ABC transporter ATP-binding protein